MNTAAGVHSSLIPQEAAEHVANDILHFVGDVRAAQQTAQHALALTLEQVHGALFRVGIRQAVGFDQLLLRGSHLHGGVGIAGRLGFLCFRGGLLGRGSLLGGRARCGWFGC